MPSRVSRGVAVPEMNARLPFAIALMLALGGCSSLDVSAIKMGNLNPFTGEDALRQSSFDYFYKKDTVSAGPVTATDLWAAVAEARQPGSIDRGGGCDRHQQPL